MIWVQVTACCFVYFQCLLSSALDLSTVSRIWFVHISAKPHKRGAASADCSRSHHSTHQQCQSLNPSVSPIPDTKGTVT